MTHTAAVHLAHPVVRDFLSIPSPDPADVAMLVDQLLELGCGLGDACRLYAGTAGARHLDGIPQEALAVFAGTVHPEGERLVRRLERRTPSIPEAHRVLLARHCHWLSRPAAFRGFVADDTFPFVEFLCAHPPPIPFSLTSEPPALARASFCRVRLQSEQLRYELWSADGHPRSLSFTYWLGRCDRCRAGYWMKADDGVEARDLKRRVLGVLLPLREVRRLVPPEPWETT